MYFSLFIHIRSAGIYQTSTVCPELVSTVGESQFQFLFACEGVLAVLFSFLSKLEQKVAHL